MRWLVLLLMSVMLYTVLLLQDSRMDVSLAIYDPFGRLEWVGGRVDYSIGNKRGVGQLAFYRSDDRFTLYVRYEEHEQRITARFSPSLREARFNSQAFKVLDIQGAEIGTGDCVFVEDFGWGDDYTYFEGGDNCDLSFTDETHGKVEISMGFPSDEGLRYVEGRVTKGTYDFAWWLNSDGPPLASISTTSYQGQSDTVRLSYAINERYRAYMDSSFALTLSTAGKEYYITALADQALPGAIWGRDTSFRLLNPITESSKIGQGSCQRTVDSLDVTCNFEFNYEDQKVTLTKTFHLDELTSIAGTVVAGDKTIRWEAIDMQEFTTASPL